MQFLTHGGVTHELHQRHDVLAIRALRVQALPARNPGFEDVGNGIERLLDSFLDRGRLPSQQASTALLMRWLR